MDAANSRRAGVQWRHALAGLQAGVLGALVFAAWLMFASLWLRRSVWSGPNLFSIVFYGPDGYVNGFLRSSSLAGFALIILIYGSLGLLWGVLCQDTKHAYLRLFGALTGLAVYAAFFHFIWPHTRPLLALYAPQRQLQVAHMLWGIVLASSPALARRLDSVSAPASDAGTRL